MDLITIDSSTYISQDNCTCGSSTSRCLLKPRPVALQRQRREHLVAHERLRQVLGALVAQLALMQREAQHLALGEQLRQPCHRLA